MADTTSFIAYKQALEKNSKIKRWRFTHTTSQASTVGFSKKAVADIYQPASQIDDIRVSYAIEFEDKKIAYGRVNPLQSTPEEMIASAEKTAIVSLESLPLAPKSETDSFPVLIEPSGYPDHLLSKLLPEATELREQIKSHNPKAYQGEISGNHSFDLYGDSNGLELSEEAVCYSGQFEYDGIIEANEANRRYGQVLPILLSRVTPLANYAKELHKPIISPKTTRLPIYLYGGDHLIDAFLLSNLGGMRILSGASKFKAEDFKNQLQVARPDFTLHLDQTRDLHENSFGFTDEGVVAQKYDLIKDGKLTQPICDLKSAHRLGYAPRVGGSTGSAMFQNLTSLDEARKKSGTYLLAFSAMGIFTQNTVLGSYSLPISECLYFENGELVGPVKAVITGNFFDVMMSDEMQFIENDLDTAPLLYFETDVTFSS